MGYVPMIFRKRLVALRNDCLAYFLFFLQIV